MNPREITRRNVLAAALAGALATTSRRGFAEDASPYDADLDLRNLRLLDVTEGGRRFLLITPRYQNADAPIPLVVFLHGLGETTNERLGAYAWLEKYGLGSAWQRMKRAPIERTSKRGEWTEPRLAEFNAELAARPFRGFAMACPFMPNPRSPADHDSYAKWLETSLVPRCRKEANVLSDAEHTYLCGVSLGGYVALEMMARLPTVFGALAGVQTAIGTWAAEGYAQRIAKAGPKPILLLTSTLDTWKTSSEALATSFTARSIKHEYRVVPGPHDQAWLREAGTIETLHWLDRLTPASEVSTAGVKEAATISRPARNF